MTLRVALVIGTLGLGGAETQMVGLARELHRRGVEVDVLLLNDRGPLLPLLERAGVPVHAFDYPGIRFRNDDLALRPWLVLLDAVRLLRLLPLLRRRRYHVVHAYLFHAYALLVPLAWLTRVPVRIAARRGLHSALPNSLVVQFLTWVSTRLATAVVANSTVVARDAAENEAVPQRKLHVIPNAVDLPDSVADPAVRPPVGVMIANLIHYKGHLDLVEAVAGLRGPAPQIRCIGEGPMRADVEAALVEAGLDEQIVLEGRLDRAREQYLGAQYAVLASHAEGMPNAVLEAMAAGLPVIATDVGGCRELIEEGVTGFLVPAREPRRLGEALARLAADDAFRVSAGRAARQAAEAYSWDRLAERHLALYSALLDLSSAS